MRRNCCALPQRGTGIAVMPRTTIDITMAALEPLFRFMSAEIKNVCTVPSARLRPGVVCTHYLAYQRRNGYLVTWVGPTMESYLESRVNNMILFDGLPSLPAKQGRGYASALVRSLNSMVSSSRPKSRDDRVPHYSGRAEVLPVRWVSPCGGDVDGRRQPIVDGWTCARETGGF
ncbi:hypothetical protein K466DRAFT_87730 [Polyporus arcularius HHB13444]|uniref:N-acetyltransferase domain-containing protein n=1 Tax=Polyporus arcularius HHB13444 TaxID=1314778 RepID=A0A5C3PIB0_9APHY|nr:hypothetical protein K466DRAFT_87730 [Polyporus arcularius HHB13444]